MTVCDEAKEFATKAHEGQVRKNKPHVPMINHAIEVAHILEEYGFDEFVVAAGYLHDVVEDTIYTIEDIEKKFGSDIASLVMGDTEPDKSLSWEKRKKHTIDTIKERSLRHKAIVVADKISNLQDLKRLFQEKGRADFSNFKRGFDSQKWYYDSLYESLIFQQEEKHPMFQRLKELIDFIFHKKNFK